MRPDEDFMGVNILAACLLVTVCLAPRLAVAQADPHQHDHPVPERLGTVDFQTTCAPATKADFNRAHGAAALVRVPCRRPTRSKRCSSADPTCGIAAWGIALSALGQSVCRDQGRRAAREGRGRRRARADDRRRSLSASATTLPRSPSCTRIAQTVDHRDASCRVRDAPWRRVAATYPDDSEAQIF